MNWETVGRVAARLGPIADEIVFLGGATVPLLVTDSGAAPPRPTKDVDVVIEVVSRASYTGQLRDQLVELGFSEDTEPGAPLCRWIVEDLKVDIMPTSGDILGFRNTWYPASLATRVRYALPDRRQIWLVTAPCFLATKLEAFRDRGKGDYRASHDIEDLLAVVDGRPSLEAECESADAGVRQYIEREFALLLSDARFVEAAAGHLPPGDASQARFPLLLTRLRRLAGSRDGPTEAAEP